MFVKAMGKKATAEAEGTLVPVFFTKVVTCILPPFAPLHYGSLDLSTGRPDYKVQRPTTRPLDEPFDDVDVDEPLLMSLD